MDLMEWLTKIFPKPFTIDKSLEPEGKLYQVLKMACWAFEIYWRYQLYLKIAAMIKG